MPELRKGRAYAWSPPGESAIESGMVRFALDDAGNGISAHVQGETVMIRAFGPDARWLSVHPQFANALAINLVP